MTTQDSILLLMKILRYRGIGTCLSLRNTSIKFNYCQQIVLQAVNLGYSMGYLDIIDDYYIIINKIYKIGLCHSYMYNGYCQHDVYCRYIHGQKEYDLLLELSRYKCSACVTLQERLTDLTMQYDKCRRELALLKFKQELVFQHLQQSNIIKTE